LNLKGGVLADSFVIRGGRQDEFWIGSYFSQADVIRRRLEDYIVADDVSVEDATAGWKGVALVGAGGGAWLESKAREGSIFRGRRTSDENWEWVSPSASWESARGELSGRLEIPAQEMERLRIAAGIPAVPADIGSRDLPNEGGLEADAISSTKGCYLGQEVMARLKSRGKLRRRLFRVAGAIPPPRVPAPLWSGGRQAGELRSSAADGDGTGMLGLAMLSLQHFRPDAPLALSASAVSSIKALA
jgi:folate-binding protein YgfZ